MMESPWGRPLDLSYWDDQGSIPLCILQLDPADRAVLRIAGKSRALLVTQVLVMGSICCHFSVVLYPG